MLGKQEEVAEIHAIRCTVFIAAIAQLGERQTEDLEVPGSIPGLGIVLQNT